MEGGCTEDEWRSGAGERAVSREADMEAKLVEQLLPRLDHRGIARLVEQLLYYLECSSGI
jgi:hypothetical protein